MNSAFLSVFVFAGYEVVGFEKIPISGPALLIYYHGTIPIDLYYVMAKMIVHKDRQLRAVGDRFLFKIPGQSTSTKILLQQTTTIFTVCDCMVVGHLMIFSPLIMYV